LIGVLVGALAVAIRAIAQPLMGDELPFVVAFPATVLAALLWGSVPGLTAALICAAAVALPFVPPDLPSAERPLQVGGFLVASIVISLLCGQLGRAHSLETKVDAGEVPDTALTAWLRAVLWGAFLIPVTAFVVIAWWGFERAQQEAEVTASRARDMVYRHAQRTFAIAGEIAHRADQASLGDDDNVRAGEAALHQRLADMTAGLPSVVNLNVWDASGRPLARSDVFPVDQHVSVEDRTYFQEQRTAPKALGVSEVIKGRQTGLELLNATVRRSSSDGAFKGIVAVSLSPTFFREYYQSLASEDPNLASFSLIRVDGEILARWPQTPDGRTRVPPESPVLKRLAAGDDAGSLVLPATPGRETRLVSFRRVGNYPVYVMSGFSRDTMFASWVRFVALLAAILVPTTTGLVYVSWVALKKTRREQATAAELQEQIRRRANAERSMLESQKLETLAIVTGGVAHDFNNLLAIVNASLHVLKRRHPDLVEEKQVVAMSRAIQSGVRLTRQLLSFSRKQALRPETVNLQSWLPAAEGLIQSTLGANIAWQAHVEPDTLPLKVDLGELELALINLVVNARHAMPKGGAITVHAGNAAPGSSSGEPMVALSVKDSGVGIPAELLSKVFEPFFTTREKGAGSGLGLSQVQGFCAQAGGFVRIESVVGEGTTVWMNLPAAEEAALTSVKEAPLLADRLEGRILLVEDNDDVGSTSELMLRSAGLEVVRVASADAALSYIEAAHEPPDVVLSDIAMPGSINGIGLAFELRKHRPGLPVLLTTGYAEQLSEATSSGLRVLPKPTSPEDLLAELRAALRTDATGDIQRMTS
jgi:two-component system NtrC family sensor kinase